MAEAQQDATIDTGWRAIIGSSLIMTLALLGDSLLYAVLPAYAEEFGLSMVWVGIMLSANRIVRVFAYGILAQLTHRVGMRKMCLIASCTATISTALYGLSLGPIFLLGARVLWGLSYAVLVLATLSYAVSYRTKVGTRVGVGRALQRIGPILVLFAGTWLVAATGPKDVFLLLALPTALSILIALSLPKDVKEITPPARSPSLARPKPIDLLFFLQGFGVDGVFALSITLILARDMALPQAVIGAGALMATRHFAEAIAAPLFGWIADRLGASKVFFTATFLTLLGFVLVAMGATIAGALVMLFFRGALASLGPAVIAQSAAAHDDLLAPLARMQAWRDFGAAAGPLFTGALLTSLSGEFLHGVVAILILAGLLYWQLAKA